MQEGTATPADRVSSLIGRDLRLRVLMVTMLGGEVWLAVLVFTRPFSSFKWMVILGVLWLIAVCAQFTAIALGEPLPRLLFTPSGPFPRREHAVNTAVLGALYTTIALVGLVVTSN